MDARRQHRIIYQTKIRMRAPGREESVVARVQNLSANGMFVTASDLPDAGTEVQCRLTLGGERRTLRGRVAWVRPASPATPLKSPGAGIEFLELDQRDSELLTRLVDPTDERRRPVDVWFEGMTAPIRCQAVVAGDGLRLETRLPFMRLHSDVRVAFTQQNPPEIRQGVLHGVTLEPSPEDGVPFLCIGVTVPPLDNARGTIEAAAGQPPREKTPLASTLVDPALAAASLGTGASPRHALSPEHDSTQRIGLSQWSGGAVGSRLGLTSFGVSANKGPQAGGVAGLLGGQRNLLFGVLLGGAVAAAVAWIAWPQRGPRSEASVVAQAPTVPGATPAPGPAPELPPATAAAAAGAAEMAIKAPPTPAVAEEAPLLEPGAGAGTGAAAGPEIVPLAGAKATGADAGNGLSVGTTEGHVIFTIALDGKSAGANPIKYNEPMGLGVALPRAKPRAGFGTFRPDAGPVRMLSRRRGAGSLVRFFYDQRTFQGKLAIEAETLRLVLAPK